MNNERECSGAARRQNDVDIISLEKSLQGVSISVLYSDEQRGEACVADSVDLYILPNQKELDVFVASGSGKRLTSDQPGSLTRPVDGDVQRPYAASLHELAICSLQLFRVLTLATTEPEPFFFALCSSRNTDGLYTHYPICRFASRTRLDSNSLWTRP